MLPSVKQSLSTDLQILLFVSEIDCTSLEDACPNNNKSYTYTAYLAIFFKGSYCHGYTHRPGTVVHYYFADDDNRVILKPLADVSDCQKDYINACYVDVREFIIHYLLKSIFMIFVFVFLFLQGYSIPNKFLVTQGKLCI